MQLPSNLLTRNSLTRNFYLHEDAETLAVAAASFIQLNIAACIKKKQCCRIALPGGNTPARCLQKLSKLDLPWQQIEWYLGDERCLPVGHTERNDCMIRQALFSSPRNSARHFYPIKAELGAEKAAQDYSLLFRSFDALDIVILGMGEDGHTASLFPDNKALTDQHKVVPVFNAPKPPPERVSLSLSTLSSVALRIVLVVGENKTAALNKIQAGEALPVNRIGNNHWFVDRAAAG